MLSSSLDYATPFSLFSLRLLRFHFRRYFRLRCALPLSAAPPPRCHADFRRLMPPLLLMRMPRHADTIDMRCRCCHCVAAMPLMFSAAIFAADVDAIFRCYCHGCRHYLRFFIFAMLIYAPLDAAAERC